MSYILVQFKGQVALQNKARLNSEVLSDVRVKKQHRNKIKLIENYKKYFQDYWDISKVSNIYTKTTLLNQNAVSYLVISSNHYEIKAKKECFPIVGCFPYLGFFYEKDALDYQSKLEKKGIVTYKRPVYAYSTLGAFTDTILSSFFNYSDKELAFLVFHELFHTMFFVQNEVELNENLANHFAENMALEYFKSKDPKYFKQYKRKKEISSHLSSYVVQLAKKASKVLKKEKTMKENENALSQFVIREFIPKIEKECNKLKISKEKCYFLRGKWNNARFAAFKTYENKANKIELLHKKLGLNLTKYFEYIKIKFHDYRDLGIKGTFTSYLLSR